jgi:hypothetical protein
MQRADLQYWKKHHSPPAVACYFVLSCLHEILRGAGYGLALCVRKSERAAYRHKVEQSLACLGDLLGYRFPSQRPSARRAELAVG